MEIVRFQNKEGAWRYIVTYASEHPNEISGYADDRDFSTPEEARRRAVQVYNESKIVLAS
jgi:hypothetical protein